MKAMEGGVREKSGEEREKEVVLRLSDRGITF